MRLACGLSETPRPLPSVYVHRGADICRVANVDILFCDVRETFIEWAATKKRQRKANNATSLISHTSLSSLTAPMTEVFINVAKQPRIGMAEHAEFKYLLHLDGQSCSSRCVREGGAGCCWHCC